MATPVLQVYNFFLAKVKDYSFIQLNNDGKLDGILYQNLISATVRFTNCNKSLDIDELSQEFSANLSIDEKEILSMLMLSNYVSGKVLSVENLEQVLSERDYSMKSQANHLSQLLALKKEIQSEVSQLLNSYSLKNNGLEDFD